MGKDVFSGSPLMAEGPLGHTKASGCVTTQTQMPCVGDGDMAFCAGWRLEKALGPLHSWTPLLSPPASAGRGGGVSLSSVSPSDKSHQRYGSCDQDGASSCRDRRE
jgi:hypothetical protein